MTANLTSPSSDVSRSPGQRGFILVLALMFLMFAGVVWQRHRLRAHWWGIQLAGASTTEDKAEFIARIAAQGPQGHDVLFGLAHEDDREIRQMLLAILAGLPVHECASAYHSLLRDNDAEVRETAALDLAFRDQPAATELIVSAARDESSAAAITAMAALRRIGVETVATCLSDIITTSPDPSRRAQAVESLLIWLETHGRDLLLHPTEPGQDIRAPVAAALASALNDVSTFQGKLAFEREVAAVGNFLGATSVAPADKIDADTTRRIDGFTRAKLSELIDAAELTEKSAVTRADVAALLDRWQQLPHRPPPSLPDGVELPD